MQDHHISEARSLYEAGYDSDHITRQLSALGLDEEQAKHTLQAVKKMHLEKRRTRGLIFLGIGGFCLFAGFLFSAIMFHSNTSPTLFLYGFTSIGIVFLLAGMADCLGL